MTFYFTEKNQEKHDERLEAVLKPLVEAGLTLNLDKCKFLLHVISSRGIEDLPPPQNLQEVRTFLGMVNQLSKFSEHLADKAKSIRELLCRGNQWIWGTERQKAFEQIKADPKRAPVLTHDPNKETKIVADALLVEQRSIVFRAGHSTQSIQDPYPILHTT